MSPVPCFLHSLYIVTVFLAAGGVIGCPKERDDPHYKRRPPKAKEGQVLGGRRLGHSISHVRVWDRRHEPCGEWVAGQGVRRAATGHQELI
jgi:hypothetical protein